MDTKTNDNVVAALRERDRLYTGPDPYPGRLRCPSGYCWGPAGKFPIWDVV